LRSHRAAVRVDVDAFHRRKVDHQAALDCGFPRHVMSAAANRYLQTEVAREVDSVDDIGHPEAASDQCWASVYQTIVDPSCLVIPHGSRL
jgi:hypothetical protein